VFYYLAVVLIIYVTFLLARRADRRARQAFGGRLSALYRTRGEFWRLRAWAQEAHDRGDADAGTRFSAQSAELLARITGESTALRLDYPVYAGEIGWTAGMLDDELADMGRALTVGGVEGYERWTTGQGRPPVDLVLNPAPGMDDDALTGRIHMAFGVAAGAAGGFVAWMVTYWGDVDARLSTLFFFMLIGAAVLGHVAREARATLWSGLLTVRRRGWLDPI
jgi:hypothetical protein